MKKDGDGVSCLDGNPLGLYTNRAGNIRYAPEAIRLETYARWPASSPVTARTLCEAGILGITLHLVLVKHVVISTVHTTVSLYSGFYFTGFDDQVRCFYCSGGLRSWQTSDDPWEEHARLVTQLQSPVSVRYSVSE